MRLFGVLAVVVGISCSIYFFMFFDASVAVPGVSLLGIPDMRVNNVGLLQDKQNGMFFGIGLAVAGAILIAFSVAKPKETNISSYNKKCPFCAEYIKEEAVICRFCNRSIPPVNELSKIIVSEPEIVVPHPNVCRKCGLMYEKEISICPDCDLDLEIV